jgi:hypothetical protein
MFGAPEKRTYSNGSVYYYIGLKTPLVLERPLTWSRTELKQDIGIQNDIMEVRTSVLQGIAETKSLFTNPPTEKSLMAMSNKWGLLVSRDGTCQWSDVNVWSDVPEELKGVQAAVQLTLSGLHISPASIRPVWAFKVSRLLPEESESNKIEFVFASDDVQSVHSADIETDMSDEIVQLTNLEAEKREAKQRVRDLIEQAQAARRLAEAALDTFMEEYDLSEDESDFSDMD